MIKKILKWTGIVLATIVIGFALFVFSARFADGPVGLLAGGPFESGELAPAPADWSFLTDRMLIEFQTLEPARSRTVWLGVYDGRLFLVSGYMNSGIGEIWKQWPSYLEEDDRIILRVDGNLYEQRLERIMGGPDVVPVLTEYDRKYGTGAVTDDQEVTSGNTWMFEVVDR